MAVSINRWPVLDGKWSDPRLATGTAPGTDIKITVRRDLLPLFLALAADYHRTVHPLRKGEVWGFDYRIANAGGGAWSDHSSGTAIDLNSAHEGAQGPNGGMATMTKAEIAACVALKKKYRVVIWGGDRARGGDYGTPRYWDPMHYALKPGTTEAQVRDVIADLGIQPDGTVKASAWGTVVTVVHDTVAYSKPSRLSAKVRDSDGAVIKLGVGERRRVKPAPGHPAWLVTEAGNYLIKRRTDFA